MDFPRYLDCLASDYARLRAVAVIDLDGAVPTCPGWSVADLTRHVGEVYLHKTAAMRDGAEPDQWPPPGLADEEPIGLLERAYAALQAEFASRKPGDPAGTWYRPDQSVGFWMRRMAQETVIHRIDAELGTAQSVAAVPSDLAVDGIDELLKIFAAYSVANWSTAFDNVLGGTPARSYAVQTDGAAWHVRTAPGTFTVADGTAGQTVDVTISGPPTEVLRWVWNREGPNEVAQVSVAGPPDAVAQLKRCIVIATQ
jgi:uncharacterized protein (TIGR03083 family)